MRDSFEETKSSFADYKSVQQAQAEVERRGRLRHEDAFSDPDRDVMRARSKARKAYDDRLFVEPAAWAPAYQAWEERAKSTRELERNPIRLHHIRLRRSSLRIPLT